ncbi:MAG: twin-arginine translocase TatA/TatE family subunit [Gemmatimonadales bacterium]|nr:MAG: twin-arginine translocase TatA/TatE family subunit [Gemmatimonadales bacterium]
MFGGIGIPELVLIFLALLLLFGAKRIPLIARGMGEGIRNFKGGLQDRDKLPDTREDPDARDPDERRHGPPGD